jgi:hypothetical protein
MKKLLVIVSVVLALLAAPATGVAGAADSKPAPSAETRDRKEVLDSVVDAITKRLDQAVAEGKLDAARAEAITARLERFASRIRDAEPGARLHRRPRAALRRHLRRAAVGIAATTIGVEPKALREARRDGQSIADVARAHDVDPQTVIDAVTGAAAKKIDGAVDAGRIDADRAATIKERVADRVTRLVNVTPAERTRTAA